jgi:hypothetical protein
VRLYESAERKHSIVDTPFGLEGTLQTTVPLGDLAEDFTLDGIRVSVADGVLRAGYERTEQEGEAKRVVADLVTGWMFRHNIKVQCNLDRSRRPGPNGRRETLVNLRVVPATAVIGSAGLLVPDGQGNTLVQRSHPYSFAGTRDLAVKAAADPALAAALRYFIEEVIDDNRPLYGIYKALEELTGHLAPNESAGRRALAALANEPKAYVDAVMETTQVQRHARTPARRLLTEVSAARVRGALSRPMPSRYE